MEIKLLPLDQLKPFAKNPNKHPDKQINSLKKSMREFGFTSPILLSQDNMVIAGHARLQAATELGLNDVPTIFIDLPYEKAVAYVIADNQLARLAEVDTELMRELLEGVLQIPDFDIEAIGFDLDEVNGLLDVEPLEVREDIFDPDEEVETRCKAGDLWELGSHRLYCGDSSVKENINKLIGKNKIDLIITDPPYGIKRDKGFDGSGGFGGYGKSITRREYKDDWDGDRPSKDCFDLILSIADKILIFGGNYFADLLPQGKHWIVWDKNNTMPTFGDAELIWTNIKRDSVKIKEFEYNGLIGKEKERFHPTQKPVKLIAEIIEEYGEDVNRVMDFFAGSGTTLMASEQMNKSCFCSEISEHYCDVIITRWEQFTGKTAIKIN